MKLVKYIFVLLTVVLPSCVHDNTSLCPDERNGKIQIQIKVPELTGTRAETIVNHAAHEYDIDRENLYVFVFNDKGGSGDNDTFMYYTQPVQELAHPDNPTTRKYSITLQKSEDSTEKQKLVFIANCTDEVEALLADPDRYTLTKKDLFAKLQFGIKAWGTQDPIPMWGESPRSVVVTYSTKGGDFGMIDMLFAVARVDVAVKANGDYTEADGLSHFVLKYAEIRNARTRGYVVPRPAAQFNGSVVKYPSTVPEADGNQILAAGTGETTTAFSIAGRFFMHEADNKNSTNDMRAFLLIGGYYTAQGEPQNTTVMSYYRIDFYDRSKPGVNAVDYLDVLRGHRYMVNITGADGPGYPTPEEAAGSVTTKMNTKVEVWNTNGLVTGITGDYALSVSQPEFSFDGAARGDTDTDNKVDIFTDYAEGWKVRAITDVTGGTEIPAGWLSVDKSGGDPYATTALSVNVTEYNSATQRYGRIYIEAGKWTYIINVEQKQD